MKTIALYYTLLALGVLGWCSLTYLAKNTYFRPVWNHLLEQQRADARESGQLPEPRELNNEESAPYRLAVSGGSSLAAHLYFPMVGIVLLSLVFIWHMALAKDEAKSKTAAKESPNEPSR